MSLELRSGIVLMGSVVALATWAASYGAASGTSSEPSKYCIRLIGAAGVPVASKDIAVSSDDDARSFAAAFLNDYDRSLAESSEKIAYPFIVIEGHACDNLELKLSGEMQSPKPHYHHRHHHRMKAM